MNLIFFEYQSYACLLLLRRLGNFPSYRTQSSTYISKPPATTVSTRPPTTSQSIDLNHSAIT